MGIFKCFSTFSSDSSDSAKEWYEFSELLDSELDALGNFNDLALDIDEDGLIIGTLDFNGWKIILSYPRDFPRVPPRVFVYRQDTDVDTDGILLSTMKQGGMLSDTNEYIMPFRSSVYPSASGALLLGQVSSDCWMLSILYKALAEFIPDSEHETKVDSFNESENAVISDAVETSEFSHAALPHSVV